MVPSLKAKALCRAIFISEWREGLIKSELRKLTGSGSENDLLMLCWTYSEWGGGFTLNDKWIGHTEWNIHFPICNSFVLFLNCKEMLWWIIEETDTKMTNKLTHNSWKQSSQYSCLEQQNLVLHYCTKKISVNSDCNGANRRSQVI